MRRSAGEVDHGGRLQTDRAALDHQVNAAFELFTNFVHIGQRIIRTGQDQGGTQQRFTQCLLKHNTPGAYTFILQATKEVPRRLQHPKRSTVGVRIPDHPVALALLQELGEPLLSSTLIMPDADYPLTDVGEIREQLESRVDLVIEGGAVGLEPTTVIDLTGAAPQLLRAGRGDVTPFGVGS